MEVWKAVHGFEGLYEVSNAGRVRSLDRIVNSKRRSRQKRKGRILRPGKAHYLNVNLVDGDRRMGTKVHILVLLSFVGPRPAGMEVCHINGNPYDNRLENLKYGTPKENQSHRIAHGTLYRGADHAAAKLTDDKVRWIRKNRNKYSLAKMAKMLGVCTKTVHYVTQGITWKHVI